MPTAKKTVPNGKVKKKTNVLDRISDIGFDEDDGIKITLYGTSGSGKTTLWATFPKPALAVITSGGNKPGELRSIDTPENRGKVKQVALENSEELREIIEYVREEGAFSTVVLDHCTGFQDLVLKEILGLDKIPEQKGWGLADQQDYGQCTQQCKEYFRELLSLDCNVVFIAQERTFGDDSGSEILTPTVGAALFPNLAGWLNSSVDYVCQTFKRKKTKRVEIKNKQTGTTKVQYVPVKGVEYCLRTGPDPVFMSKFRLPKGTPLPDVIVDPTFDDIYALIKGEGTRATKE